MNLNYEPEENSEGYQIVEDGENTNRFTGDIFDDEKIEFDPWRRKAARKYKLQFEEDGPSNEWDNNDFSGKQSHRFLLDRERTGKLSKKRQKRKFSRKANLDKRY